VRRVAAVHQQPQAHQVAGQPGDDNSGAQLVARLGASPWGTLFLRDPSPLAAEHVQLYVLRIPTQRRPDPAPLAGIVVEHGPGRDLGQPVVR
jgi:hypothetical protein